jgi:hypothetical protein
MQENFRALGSETTHILIRFSAQQLHLNRRPKSIPRPWLVVLFVSHEAIGQIFKLFQLNLLDLLFS